MPAPVRRYLERVLPDDDSAPRKVRIRQEGEMWLKPRGRRLRFTAVEDFAVQEVAFFWRAAFPIAPLVTLRIVDRYGAGEGSLEGRLLGLPIMRSARPEVSVGQALRYLAELPWVPHAIRANRSLEWRELDAETVQVGTKVGSTPVALRLTFDAAGDIVGATCDARPRREGKVDVLRPWAGSFNDYAVTGGVRVPTRAEVWWELPDGPFTYWRGRVVSLELDPRNGP